MFYKILLSIITGLATGAIYGLLFARSHKRTLLLTSSKSIMLSSIISSLRLILLAILFFYLLRLNLINFIILLPAFFIAFWFTILKQRG